MKFRLPAHAFLPLELTDDEKRWLRDECNAVVAETLRAERHFVSADGRAHFPKKDWKQVRHRDDFAVYKQRHTASKHRSNSSSNQLQNHLHANSTAAATATTDSQYGASNTRHFSVDSMSSDDNLFNTQTSATNNRSASATSGAYTASSLTDDDSIVASMKEPHVPMLMAAGKMGGTMDDVCFGALAGDDVAWRLRTAYVKDKFADAKILASIDGPVAADPFRSLCIKWFTKELPALVGSFIQRRDFVILEATGSGVDSDGVPYRYYMLHSVKLPGAPELTGLDVLRCKVSLCFVCRNLAGNSSHLFARGFSDPRGDLLEPVAVALTAESLIAATLTIECAYVKKLMWLMHKKQRLRQQRTRAATSATPAECDACHRGTKKLGRTTHLHSCQACGHSICNKCSVQKRIIIDISGDGVVDRPLTFCLGCVLEANRLPSWDVAVDALVRPDSFPKAGGGVGAMAMPPPVPVPGLPRSQSLGVEETRRTMYATSVGEPHRSTTSGVRAHSSKSIAGVVLY